MWKCPDLVAVLWPVRAPAHPAVGSQVQQQLRLYSPAPPHRGRAAALRAANQSALRWEVILDYPGGPSIVMRVLRKWEQEAENQHRNAAERGRPQCRPPLASRVQDGPWPRRVCGLRMGDRQGSGFFPRAARKDAVLRMFRSAGETHVGPPTSEPQGKKCFLSH